MPKSYLGMFDAMLNDKYPSDIDAANYTILASPESKANHPALGLNIPEAAAVI